ncbi:S-adenosyl-L-methionine-dependent methyltransferase [Cyathus striatus]|nr:S-adenosyl-L-methionine-dependent methyltransferase [Cyathus striatus]
MAHHHNHHEHHDYVGANRDHFDDKAHDFNSYPHAIERAKQSALAIRNVYPFDKEKTMVMEYACGTGLVSREIAPYVKSIVGVDISQGVVNIFNEQFVKQGYPPENFYAIQADLKGEEGELDGKKFDVIICTAVYHHFPSVEETTHTLSFFLKPGGALIVIDRKLNDGNDVPEQYGHIVAHKHGFSEEDMRKLFEEAGLTGFSFEDIASIGVKEDVNPFIAKGIKGE